MFNLDLLTSYAPSCVVSKVSHISLIALQFDTLTNSSTPKAKARIFFALLSYWIFFLLYSFHASLGINYYTPSTIVVGMMGNSSTTF